MRPSSASTRSEAVVLSEGAARPDQPMGQPVSTAAALASTGPGLVPFSFWLPPNNATKQVPPDPAGLRCAIAAHLASLGWPGAEPMRWAITSVDPLRGLQLEGLGLHHAEQERR